MTLAERNRINDMRRRYERTAKKAEAVGNITEAKVNRDAATACGNALLSEWRPGNMTRNP